MMILLLKISIGGFHNCKLNLNMFDKQSFNVRPMQLSDLENAFGLSKTEGWNQTEISWRLLFENPKNICLVAEYNNKVVGTATAINHSNQLAWIGMVLVDKYLRGQGIGKMLVESIISELKNIKSIKLDATPAGQPLYQKLGFKEEHTIFRMICTSSNSLPAEVTENKPVHPDSKSFSELLELDKHFFGTDRSSLLQTLFQNYPQKVFVLKQNNKIEGYIFGRDGLCYNHLGPVFANSFVTAKILISTVLKSHENEPVAVDVLHDKEDLIKWLTTIGFEKQRQFSRMYLHKNPFPGMVENQYLICGPEYG
jgi:ribosomal protein S18 acetylase RimI-like enzyme